MKRSEAMTRREYTYGDSREEREEEAWRRMHARLYSAYR